MCIRDRDQVNAKCCRKTAMPHYTSIKCNYFLQDEWSQRQLWKMKDEGNAKFSFLKSSSQFHTADSFFRCSFLVLIYHQSRLKTLECTWLIMHTLINTSKYFVLSKLKKPGYGKSDLDSIFPRSFFYVRCSQQLHSRRAQNRTFARKVLSEISSRGFERTYTTVPAHCHSLELQDSFLQRGKIHPTFTNSRYLPVPMGTVS